MYIYIYIYRERERERCIYVGDTARLGTGEEAAAGLACEGGGQGCKQMYPIYYLVFSGSGL